MSPHSYFLDANGSDLSGHDSPFIRDGSSDGGSFRFLPIGENDSEDDKQETTTVSNSSAEPDRRSANLEEIYTKEELQHTKLKRLRKSSSSDQKRRSGRTSKLSRKSSVPIWVYSHRQDRDKEVNGKITLYWLAFRCGFMNCYQEGRNKLWNMITLGDIIIMRRVLLIVSSDYESRLQIKK